LQLEIREISFGSEIGKFIDFPHDLYADDPNYVPEIYIGQKDMMNPAKYPFHQYGKARYFLAYKDGKAAGRIAAIRNDNYNRHHKSNIGFFGFFDSINDQSVASALFAKAEEYARENGFDALMGPTNFTTNETAGVLIEGFGEPPKIMMTYNKPYYQQLYENHGFQKEMDLYAYMLYTDRVSDKSLRIAESLEARLVAKGITIRNLKLKDIDAEAKRIQKIYNAAWEDNWGFVPFTDAEFEYLKNDLKMIVDERWAYIAEKDGEAIAFGLTVPNINEILIKNKRGRIFPFGIFRLLFGKKSIRTVRILALGVLEEYRKQGIEAIFFAKNIKMARELGIVGGEASWILENNEPMVKAAEHLNGERYKTYRLYKKQI
jgi:GNAT superfamily N-acetyltransferase